MKTKGPKFWEVLLWPQVPGAVFAAWRRSSGQGFGASCLSLGAAAVPFPRPVPQGHFLRPLAHLFPTRGCELHLHLQPSDSIFSC